MVWSSSCAQPSLLERQGGTGEGEGQDMLSQAAYRVAGADWTVEGAWKGD